MSAANAPAMPEEAIWHDVECGSYTADLPVWEELASRGGGPVLELGAGTGRVALALARAGHDVVAAERDPELAGVLAQRAAGTLEVVRADILELALGRHFSLVVAPMQLLQIVGGAQRRTQALEVMARHLAPNGVAAAAIVATLPAGDVDAGELLPDVREVDGWVYSSLPVALRADDDAFEADRVRQRVSPGGDLEESRHSDRLDRLSAAQLDTEAERAGLATTEHLGIPGDDAYVGSIVCVWERR
jgi:SAM-dependent methyltransferase